MFAEPFAPPPESFEETLAYRVRARPRSQFKTVLDAQELFGAGARSSRITTRYEPSDEASPFVVEVAHDLASMGVQERLVCDVSGGLRTRHFERRVLSPTDQTRRLEQVDFDGLITMPPATYPEVMLPFAMRWQPRDKQVRATYSWTADRFVARVYYERRREESVEVPAGRFDAVQVWMYPDLNDWIAMGSIVTRLAKPLLPRYTIWFETRPPYRVLRFEGPYGPPGAPEIVLELAD